MDPEIARIIVQDQAITYAVTDRTLRIVEVGGSTNLFATGAPIEHGALLFDFAPELIGYEQEIAALLAGQSARFCLPLVNREVEAGTTSYLTIVNLPYLQTNNEIAGIIHVVSDVTLVANAEQIVLQQRNELAMARDQLRKQNQKLEMVISELQHLDMLKSQFITVAAHELRNPISTIMLYARMVLDEETNPLPKKYDQSLKIINRNAERLSRITSNLLDVLKLELGQMELIILPIDLVGVIEKSQMDMLPALAEKKQQLMLHCTAGLPQALCDEDRMLQILSNLIYNASKYSPDGSEIEVHLRLADEPEYLQLSISDKGIGIPTADQPRLFERFFRASNAHKSEVPGSGLGLSIVRSLVEMHGGRIWIESELGVGTTVHLLLQANAN